MIVDTHVHVVAGDEERYPLQPAAGIGSSWFRDMPVTVDHYLEAMAGAGVDRAVLVQAMGAYSYDNRYVVDAANAHPGRLTSVVIVDMDDDPAGAMRRLAKDANVSGVRLFAISAPGSPQPTWLDHPRTFSVWEVAAELGWVVVATIFPPQIPQLRRMVERFGQVTVALDHCGFPDLSGGPPYAKAAPLFDLVDLPRVHFKVSSFVLEAAEADPAADPGHLVERLTEAFGADRLLWGSDYPQTHDRTYAELVELGRRACSGLDQEDQRRFLGGTALGLWPHLATP